MTTATRMRPLARRGKDGKDRRSFAFARPFAHRWIWLNDAVEANRRELLRTLRLDKLGVTGSSPVPPIKYLQIG
jgi:hypothetical protein